MDDPEFKMFVPSDGWKITPNTVVYSILAVTLGLTFFSTDILGNPYRLFEKSMIWVAWITFMLGFVVVKLKNHWQLEPYYGKLEGTLTLTPNSIIVDNQEFKLDDITEIDITATDYFNRNRYRTRGDCNPALSTGTRNELVIRTTDGTRKVIRFQMMTKDDIQQARDILFIYHHLAKMSLNQLTRALNANTFEKVQEIKKQLPPTKAKCQGYGIA